MNVDREELARILTTVAKDGLDGPRDLDVALDAIICLFRESNRGRTETRGSGEEVASWDPKGSYRGDRP